MIQEDLFRKIIAHSKEYGFIFPSSEIYDGLGAVYDYGQNGVELKNNIRRYWWEAMVRLNENIVGIDSAIFMHPTIWKASGHVDAFSDPMIDNRDSKKRYRADVLIDGERWQGPEGVDRLVVQVAEGSHRIEVRKEGFASFTTEITVRAGETAPVNVSLPVPSFASRPESVPMTPLITVSPAPPIVRPKPEPVIVPVLLRVTLPPNTLALFVSVIALASALKRDAPVT